MESNGMIDLDGVKTQMRQSRRKKIIEAHPYSIYLGNDERWHTYVKDEEKKSGRRMIVRKSLEDLHDALCEYYRAGSTEKGRQEATMASIYDDWIEYKSLHVASSTIDRVKRDWKRYYANEEIVHRRQR